MLCGRCNQGSFSFLTSQDERRAPRTIVWSVKQGRTTPTLFSIPLNGRAKELCPLAIDIDAAVIRARRRRVKKGLGTAKNAVVVEKLLRKKNPY